VIARAHKLIRALWAGDIPLAQAFWEYAVVYAFLINAAATMGSLALWSIDQMALGLIVHFAPLPYAVLTFMAVWRAAPRYAEEHPDSAHWAGIARVVIAIAAPLSAIL
jgi:hypothetical protein